MSSTTASSSSSSAGPPAAAAAAAASFSSPVSAYVPQSPFASSSFASNSAQMDKAINEVTAKISKLESEIASAEQKLAKSDIKDEDKKYYRGRLERKEQHLAALQEEKNHLLGLLVAKLHPVASSFSSSAGSPPLSSFSSSSTQPGSASVRGSMDAFVQSDTRKRVNLTILNDRVSPVRQLHEKSEFLIDTGFFGELCLSGRKVVQLGLRKLRESRTKSANNIVNDVYYFECVKAVIEFERNGKPETRVAELEVMAYAKDYNSAVQHEGRLRKDSISTKTKSSTSASSSTAASSSSSSSVAASSLSKKGTDSEGESEMKITAAAKVKKGKRVREAMTDQGLEKESKRRKSSKKFKREPSGAESESEGEFSPEPISPPQSSSSSSSSSSSKTSSTSSTVIKLSPARHRPQNRPWERASLGEVGRMKLGIGLPPANPKSKQFYLEIEEIMIHDD